MVSAEFIALFSVRSLSRCTASIRAKRRVFRTVIESPRAPQPHRNGLGRGQTARLVGASLLAQSTCAKLATEAKAPVEEACSGQGLNLCV